MQPVRYVDRVQMLDFVRLRRNEESAERKDRKPKRPEPAGDPRRAAERKTPTWTPAIRCWRSLAPTLGTGCGYVGRSGIGLGTGDGEYLPIVKVAPIYPRRALERGITGECLVVPIRSPPAGTVRDVSVVEGQCPESVFERPSVEAALRFKLQATDHRR
jgi:protein TonB